MKRFVLIFTLLVVAMGASVDRVDAQTAEAAFRAENPRIDMGDIKAGTEVVATFVFHNSGPADVRILKAKPS